MAEENVDVESVECLARNAHKWRTYNEVFDFLEGPNFERTKGFVSVAVFDSICADYEYHVRKKEAFEKRTGCLKALVALKRLFQFNAANEVEYSDLSVFAASISFVRSKLTSISSAKQMAKVEHDFDETLRALMKQGKVLSFQSISVTIDGKHKSNEPSLKAPPKRCRNSQNFSNRKIRACKGVIRFINNEKKSSSVALLIARTSRKQGRVDKKSKVLPTKKSLYLLGTGNALDLMQAFCTELKSPKGRVIDCNSTYPTSNDPILAHFGTTFPKSCHGTPGLKLNYSCEESSSEEEELDEEEDVEVIMENNFNKSDHKAETCAPTATTQRIGYEPRSYIAKPQNYDSRSHSHPFQHSPTADLDPYLSSTGHQSSQSYSVPGGQCSPSCSQLGREPPLYLYDEQFADISNCRPPLPHFSAVTPIPDAHSSDQVPNNMSKVCPGQESTWPQKGMNYGGGMRKRDNAMIGNTGKRLSKEELAKQIADNFLKS